MVERLARVGHGGGELIEVHHQTGPRIGLTLHGDARAERMPVHPCVRVSGRRRGQKVRGLEIEFSIDEHEP